jgi:hypothetical protein
MWWWWMKRAARQLRYLRKAGWLGWRRKRREGSVRLFSAQPIENQFGALQARYARSIVPGGLLVISSVSPFRKPISKE